MSDLVSIITPSYNSGLFISKTIKSVLAQTYQLWEMIIVDDSSFDDSTEIIQSYVDKDTRIRLIRLNKKSGPAFARNTAIKEARGQYIAFLDSDDLWLPIKLERQLEFMNKNNLAFTYSSYELIDENDKKIGHFKTRPNITYKTMLKTCSVGCLTAIYSTKKLGKIFMPDIPKRQDYALWLKILKLTNEVAGDKETFAQYRIRKSSLSSNKVKSAQHQWKVYRDVEKLNFFRSITYFIQYMFYGIFKYK